MASAVSRLRRWTVRAAWLGAAGIAGGALAWWALPWAVDLPEDLLRPLPASPRILDRDGREIASLPDATWLRQRPLVAGDLPPDVIAATLAAEDKRFFSHGGVDVLAVARAVRDGLRHGRLTSGASTISQQLVKVSRPPAPRTVPTKIYEMLAARQLEMRWDKRAILAAYLNRIEYGNQRRGLAEAARFYFGKPPGDLSLAECALLAGLPQAPSRLDPLRHPDRALERRATVLDRLERTGTADAGRLASARSESLGLRAPGRAPQRAPHVLVALRDAANAEQQDAGEGLRTTLSLPMQTDVQTIVAEELARMSGRGARHAAVVVLDNATGGILALTGSAGFDRPGGQINGTATPRSAGSTLKPFTYLLAFESGGRFPGSVIPDIPTPWRTLEGLDLPRNYDGRHRGPVSIRAALANSLNLPALHELNALGGPVPLARLLERFGVDLGDAEPESFGLGLTIGNAEVTLLDLTGAYSALARLGRLVPPTLLADEADGRTRPGPGGDLATESVVSPEAAWLVADILADNTARAESFGLDSPLRLPFRCAAKTGTSSDFRDNWCIGFTSDITIGVWVGNFDNAPMDAVSGVAGAGPIFQRVMVRAHRGVRPGWPDPPPGVVAMSIDPLTGRRIDHRIGGPGGRPAISQVVISRARPEWCLADRPPPPASEDDYDADGRALLDRRFREWFESEENAKRHLYVIADRAVPVRRPVIVQPQPDAVYLLDPELPSGGRVLRLVSNLSGPVVWECESLPREGDTLRLEPGRHTIRLTDPATGLTATASIEVRSL